MGNRGVAKVVAGLQHITRLHVACNGGTAVDGYEVCILNKVCTVFNWDSAQHFSYSVTWGSLRWQCHYLLNNVKNVASEQGIDNGEKPESRKDSQNGAY